MSIQTDQCLLAVVDSAAEVSIILDKVYQSLKKPPKKLQDIYVTHRGLTNGDARVHRGPCSFENRFEVVS